MFQLLETLTELMENPAPGCSHYSGLAELPAELPQAQAPLGKNGVRACF